MSRARRSSICRAGPALADGLARQPAEAAHGHGPVRAAPGLGAPHRRWTAHHRNRYRAAPGHPVYRDTMRELRRRFPVRFVWLMGADNLRQLPRWGHWLRIMHAHAHAGAPASRGHPLALAGQAAARFSKHRLPARAGLCLASAAAPAWILLPVKEHSASATALRQKFKGAPP
jgi:hypothetical protein